ncbi:hypothetical protein FHU41_001905 [Psychromicrobium silvestre]|uniref:Uncharacterized protein n=1 Tax=Psychromicrobium silvestre TaxID=1645614 RepID=A0A7Y9LU94_9MICC|nr:hypothetical protein [Psychromicrobium silvestre]NYE95655.1 hypothetical protein [Psychromicrobium silvestre]
MNIELSSEVGFTASLPEGSFVVAESSAGPGSEQISLPGDILFSMVRDDSTVQSYAAVIEWTEKMASYYSTTKKGEKIAEGALESQGKKCFTSLTLYPHSETEPKVAAVTGIRFDSGEFFGLTLLWPVLDLDLEPQIDRVQRIVDGISLNA